MEHYTTHIKSKNGWFDINLRELYQYRDLVWLFFKRNYSTRYKQTILGPMWLIFNPLITVSLYALIFGRLAGLSASGVPQFLFYLCSNTLWAFFATCLTETSNTFTANAAIMGKVYFPRLVMPMSSVLTGMLDLLIQLAMLVLAMVGYCIVGYNFGINLSILLVPVLILQVGLLGLGCGIIIASLTTKYRDLVILVGFGIQLWMYATPVVYTTGIIPQKYLGLYMLNPMASIIECFRSVILGIPTNAWQYWGISWIVTFVVLFIGVILFSKIEKTFMDTV
ncbi:lipopolysaccharide transport system permease protein [Fibrobacter sp. UWB8]|uniref:ABC transporter permease n=1 Tax=Fibrobacter sp. UWB8 TaxID=1896207 RepID=UPI0009126DED|nr:ABC transporter permease [Fibrobacter sp. UWB8]SHG37404.1 lipopolysaccharide transport system permease protein [Fibrobacter sp. UWB8]